MLSNHFILCYLLLFLPSVLSWWISSSQQVAKVLELQLQHQSFQWIFRVDFLQDWLVWSPCCPRDSQESSPTPQFKNISSSVLSFLYGPSLTLVLDYWKTIALTIWIVVGKVMSLLFNMLSRFVITLLPRSKHLVISWLKSLSDKGLICKIHKESTQLNHKILNKQSNFFKYTQGINRYLSKEDMQMTNKYEERCSKPLVIREIQVKATMRYHPTPVTMTVIKKKRKGTLVHCWWECKLVHCW